MFFSQAPTNNASSRPHPINRVYMRQNVREHGKKQAIVYVGLQSVLQTNSKWFVAENTWAERSEECIEERFEECIEERSEERITKKFRKNLA